MCCLIDGTSGGNADNSGIIADTAGALVKIVRKADLAPNGNSTFGSSSMIPKSSDRRRMERVFNHIDPFSHIDSSARLWLTLRQRCCTLV
ncbi:MAG: hypothetical protein ACI9DF_004144 [Verrucomicrobiales bacterium]|jgi:hypothetical protein